MRVGENRFVFFIMVYIFLDLEVGFVYRVVIIEGLVWKIEGRVVCSFGSGFVF